MQGDTTVETSPFAGEGQLGDLLGYNLKRAAILFESDLRHALGENGMSPRVFSALSLVVGFPGITQSEVARRLGIERSGLVAIIDELETRGYVERVAVKGDRRVQALRPTEPGEKTHTGAITLLKRAEETRLGPLSAEERQHLFSALRKLRATGES